MRKITLIFLVVFTSLTFSFSQDYTPPKEIVLDTKEDYAKYEQDIIRCSEYLINASPKVNSGEKKKAEIFFMTWFMGSPNVTVELHSGLINSSINHLSY